MRFLFLVVTFFCGLLLFAKDTPKAMLVAHNDIKGPIIGFTHTEDFEIFADGRVRYSESGNDRKTGTFNARLTTAELRRLIVLLNSKEMRAVPAEIPSQIKVVDFDWEAQLNIQHASGRQTIAIKNFYPLLNTQRPTMPPFWSTRLHMAGSSPVGFLTTQKRGCGSSGSARGSRTALVQGWQRWIPSDTRQICSVLTLMKATGRRRGKGPTSRKAFRTCCAA